MRFLTLISCLSFSLNAFASEEMSSDVEETPSVEEKSPSILPAFTFGLMEVTTADVSTHLGLYGIASLDLLVPVGESRWTGILSSGVDFAPENNNWGLFSMAIADYRLNSVDAPVIWSLEPQAGVVHNASPSLDGEGFDHFVYPTAGMGVGIVTGAGTFLPTVTWSVDVNGGGTTMASMFMYSIML